MLRPEMTPSEAAKAWVRENECTDIGHAAIYSENGEMSINYHETPYGITIILKNGTALPVPYKYDGSEPILYCVK